jgi:hypothetical protein
MRRRLALTILATGSLSGWIPDLAAAQADNVMAAKHDLEAMGDWEFNLWRTCLEGAWS